MATLAQIRQQVDDKLVTLWAAIQTRQDSYAAAHNGRFWQGLRTHTLRPADGAETAPTIGTACPTDQPGAPWPAAIRTASLPMALQVDCYSGPLGNGFVATCTVTVGTRVYQRTQNSGPETWRTRAWEEVVPPV